MKFIHLSDVGLDLRREEADVETLKRNKEFEEDFLNVLRVCRDEDVDVLFITGGLFSHVPTEQELNTVDEYFENLNTTRIFLLTGRNDAPEVPAIAAAHTWRSGTTVFAGDTIQRIFLSRLNMEVTGVGYNARTWEKVKPETLSRGKKGAVQVLVLPFIGSGEAAEEAATFPKLPFDYIGIGQGAQMKGTEEKPIYAPGYFEPMTFTNQLEHGFYIGTIEHKGRNKNELHVEFRKAAKREYVSLMINCTEEFTYEEAAEKIRSAIAENGRDNIYRVVLKGQPSLSLYFMKDRLQEIEGVTELIDDTNITKLLDELKENHVDEAVSRFVEDLPEDMDADVRKKALDYGVKALLERDDAQEEDN